MKYKVNFWLKRDNTLCHSTTVKTSSDIGIIIKGKLKSLGEGFRFDRRKHHASFMQVDDE